MHKEFFVGLALTAAVFALQCRSKAACGRLWTAQSLTVCCQLWLLFGYYSPLVSKRAYEWQNMSADLITIVFDCWAIVGLLVETRWMGIATAVEGAVLVLFFVQRRAVLEWYWNSDLFRWPDTPMLTHMRFATNIAYLIAIALLYRERAHLRTGETA